MIFIFDDDTFITIFISTDLSYFSNCSIVCFGNNFNLHFLSYHSLNFMFSVILIVGILCTKRVNNA